MCTVLYFCFVISGTVTFWYGSDCGSGRPINIWILQIRFRNTSTFTSFFKDDGRIQSWSRISTLAERIRMRIQEAQKHADPMDPDLQHGKFL